MRKKILSDIYKMPAEWEKQKSTLIGWPYNEEDWPDRFHNIPKIFGQIISSLSKSQNVKVLIKEKNSKKDIVPILKRYKSKLNNIYFIVCKTDRVWLRDTGPIFLKGNRGKKILSDWKFNGWAKYKNHRNDNRVNTLIKKHYKSLKLLMDIKKFFKKNELNKIIHFMKKDKKNVSNKISLILLKKIGKTTKPKQIALKDFEIKKFLNSYYS